MISNNKGYLLPHVNEDYCIDCGLCKRKCPRLNISIKNKPRFEAYAVKNKDDSIRDVSQSGGAFWPICEYVFSKHGVVYGCSFDISNKKAIHIRATNLNEARVFHGSKYIQSDLGDTFFCIRNDLEKGMLVLFVGTPCQVAGLKSFLGKKYDKLLTIDLVCYGVSSPLIWRDYISHLEALYKGECIKAVFRDKKFGWHSHFETFLIQKKHGKLITIKDTSFKKIFSSRIAARNSCFSCQFKTIDRMGDYTIGDCWGIEKKHKSFADPKGISLFIINNDKIHEVTEFILDKLEYIELSEEDALQPALYRQNEPAENDIEFWNVFESSGISSILWKYGSLRYRISFLIRKHFYLK